MLICILFQVRAFVRWATDLLSVSDEIRYSDVDFIQFGDLSSEDKQMLHGRVAALMKSLGIPALSKVM